MARDRRRRPAEEYSTAPFGLLGIASTRRSAMLTKTTTALVAALVLASTSIAFVGSASAVPSQGISQAEQNWFDRASNGGHHVGDTNGF
jgi:hypothetical protein